MRRGTKSGTGPWGASTCLRALGAKRVRVRGQPKRTTKKDNQKGQPKRTTKKDNQKGQPKRTTKKDNQKRASTTPSTGTNQNKKRCDALSDTAPIRASRSSVKTL